MTLLSPVSFLCRMFYIKSKEWIQIFSYPSQCKHFPWTVALWQIFFRFFITYFTPFSEIICEIVCWKRIILQTFHRMPVFELWELRIPIQLSLFFFFKPQSSYSNILVYWWRHLNMCVMFPRFRFSLCCLCNHTWSSQQSEHNK